MFITRIMLSCILITWLSVCVQRSWLREILASMSTASLKRLPQDLCLLTDDWRRLTVVWFHVPLPFHRVSLTITSSTFTMQLFFVMFKDAEFYSVIEHCIFVLQTKGFSTLLKLNTPTVWVMGTTVIWLLYFWHWKLGACENAYLNQVIFLLFCRIVIYEHFCDFEKNFRDSHDHTTHFFEKY